MDVLKFSKNLIFGRNDYSPNAKKILNKNGKKPINKITIYRTPLSFLLSTALNVVSFGQFERNKPYDKLYHLFIVCDLNDGSKLLIEKNEVINLVENPKNYMNEGTESMEVLINRFINVIELLSKTRERMGDKFFLYNANSNNCQNFIVNILRANNLNTPENERFVYQNLNELFKKLPFFTKPLIDKSTELGARLDVIKQGGNIKVVLPKNKRGLSRRNELYGGQIENDLKDIHDFNGVFMKNELPRECNDGWYVINLNNSNEEGSHWTCFYKNPENILYFDSIGFPPPIEVLKQTDNILWSDKQIQDINSTACGFFCICCIRFLHNKINNKNEKELYDKFLNLFSDNTYKNDGILKKILYCET